MARACSELEPVGYLPAATQSLMRHALAPKARKQASLLQGRLNRNARFTTVIVYWRALSEVEIRVSKVDQQSATDQSQPMKLVLTALILSGVTIATSAMSADQVMIAGIGSKSCSYWLSTPTLKSEGEKWALGFWSGLNYVAAVTKDQNQLIINPDSMLSEIEKMCDQRPDQSLADSVWITFLTLNK